MITIYFTLPFLSPLLSLFSVTITVAPVFQLSRPHFSQWISGNKGIKQDTGTGAIKK
jgi:hypothetical protein